MKFYLSLVLVFISISIFGQTVSFSLDGSGQYIRPIERQFEEREQTITERRFLAADSLWVNRSIKRLYRSVHEYNPKIGIDVNWNVHIGITDRLYLKSGLGLNYILFQKIARSTFDPINDEIISTDTISTLEPFEGFIQCDVELNSQLNFSSVKEGQYNHVLSLKIPLEVEYELLQDKFFVGIGAYFQTPIYTAVVSEYFTRNIEEINGETVCEYEKVVTKNATGSIFSELQMGIGGSFTHMFSNKLGVKLGIAKDLNNIFSKSNPAFITNNNGNFRPMKFSLGLSYRFGGEYVKRKEQVENM